VYAVCVLNMFLYCELGSVLCVFSVVVYVWCLWVFVLCVFPLSALVSVGSPQCSDGQWQTSTGNDVQEATSSSIWHYVGRQLIYVCA